MSVVDNAQSVFVPESNDQLDSGVYGDGTPQWAVQSFHRRLAQDLAVDVIDRLSQRFGVEEYVPDFISVGI